MVEFAKRLTKSELFSRAILGLIILSGVMVGLETYPQFSDATALGRALSWVQTIILFCFVIEISLKIVACGSKPWTYFSDGWNTFDFLIVLICVLQPYSQSASVVRLARILRALRTITVLPRLRLLVSALLRSIPSLGYIGILLGLHFYIYSVIGTVAFGENDPIRFGSLHKTSTTLFQVLTLEGWNDVRDTQVMGSDVTYDDQWKELAGESRTSHADPVGATIYFVSFILLGTMIMLNLFTGVIISSMEEAQQETSTATGKRADQLQQRGFLTLHDELALLHEQLQSMSEQIKRLQETPLQETPPQK